MFAPCLGLLRALWVAKGSRIRTPRGELGRPLSPVASRVNGAAVLTGNRWVVGDSVDEFMPGGPGDVLARRT